MPLVAHSRLPAFESMRLEGVPVATPGFASQTGLPDLRIGLLNLMPDAALRATDRQFIRLVSAYGDSANLWVYPFAASAEHRAAAARQHINDYYTPFEILTEAGLDALIVTGANPLHVDMAREAFWEETITVFDWAQANARSTLCSCLATHAVLKKYRMVERTRLPQKRWGVYSHHIVIADHPLLAGLETPVMAPHSHHYDVSRREMESVGLHVLAESDEAGVHMAVSDDNFSFVFFQGHPEYDGISLLKEYRREVGRFVAGERPDYPPYPEHYFDDMAIAMLEKHKQNVLAALSKNLEPPMFPEAEVTPGRISTWTDAGQTIYSNWLAEVERRRGRSST